MDIWIPVAAALAGGLVAFLASIIAQTVQSRSESRRTIARLAVEAGVEEFKQAIAVVQRGGGGRIPPLNLYIYYNSRIIELIEKGKLNPKTLQSLNQEFDEIVKLTLDRSSSFQEG